MAKLPFGTINRVSFDDDNHVYSFDGRNLKGVTTAIGKFMGKTFPNSDVVKLACSYGSQVHKESENYINDAKKADTENGKWVVEQLQELKDKLDGVQYEAEKRVSDFENTASNVDIVLHLKDGTVALMDIKTGSFDREYCSLQLSIYKMLYENSYPESVSSLFVINTKAKRVFKIFLKDEKICNKILDLNKEE